MWWPYWNDPSTIDNALRKSAGVAMAFAAEPWSVSIVVQRLFSVTRIEAEGWMDGWMDGSRNNKKRRDWANVPQRSKA
jgi:hypothetical protein